MKAERTSELNPRVSIVVDTAPSRSLGGEGYVFFGLVQAGMPCVSWTILSPADARWLGEQLVEAANRGALDPMAPDPLRPAGVDHDRQVPTNTVPDMPGTWK